MRKMLFMFFLACVFILGCTETQMTVECNKILDSKQADECLYNQSTRYNDASKCQEISNMDVKAKCIDQVAINSLDFFPCKNHDRKPFEDACENKVGDARRKARENS